MKCGCGEDVEPGNYLDTFGQPTCKICLAELGKATKAPMSGITLRDFFAGLAMVGNYALNPNKQLKPEEASRGAYKVADAMLKARENNDDD